MPEQLRVLRWEKPADTIRGRPEGRSRTTRFDTVVAEMRDNPGLWAVIWEGRAKIGGSIATIIRTGSYQCFQPAGDFEAVTRIRAGVQTVYARYLGDGGGDGA